MYEIVNGDSEIGEQITRLEIKINDPCNEGSKNYAYQITINGNVIQAWIGDGGELFYLSNTGKFHIRPKKEYIEQFYASLDYFERILLNRRTNPKYKSTFSVIYENQYGYYRKLEDFIFPTSYGGYNLSFSNTFVDRLYKIGQFYDEKFSDNLYRSLTHEAIKNFDWSYTREKTDDGKYLEAGRKIEKALRLYGREFDEAKLYIDALNNNNTVTYDDRGNLPDYFLTDTLEDEGWDVKLVYPYSSNGLEVMNPKIEKKNPIVRNFSLETATVIKPYSDSVSCPSYTAGCSNDSFVILKTYRSEDEYSFADINNAFMKRLKLSSRDIWRHKGTLESIDMVLGMFGLHNKDWCYIANKQKNGCTGALNQYRSDYSVEEYTSFAKPIDDKWDPIHQMYRIDWLNSTKTITYNYRDMESFEVDANGYIPYQGLPLVYRYATSGDSYTSECYLKKVANDYDDYSSTQFTSSSADAFTNKSGEAVKRRLLYPNFNKNEQYDGNPYYQMDGGWLSRRLCSASTSYNFAFDSEDIALFSEYKKEGSYDESTDKLEDNFPIFTETIRNIRSVKDVGELTSYPMISLEDNVIFHVDKVDNDICVIDGKVYKVNRDNIGRYVSFIKNNGAIKVSEYTYFDEDIMVYYNNNGNISSEPRNFLYRFIC